MPTTHLVCTRHLLPVVEYDAPAVTTAYWVHAAPAPVVEYAPAPDVAYRAHAASAPEVAPAPDVAYGAPAAPDPKVEYIASAAAGYAGPAPDEEKYFISITRLEELNYAALTIQWWWTLKRIVLRAASEERLEEKLREVRRRLVACLPVGASAKEKTHSLRDMQSTLNAVEKDWRMIFDEELANLELDLGVRSSRVEVTQVLRLGMASTILLAATRRHLQSWCRTRHQSELAHIPLHLVFGMESMHPDCSGAAV